MKRILKRALISIVVLSTLTTIIVPIAYYRWRVETFRALESGSQLAETSKGTVEYASVGNSVRPREALAHPARYTGWIRCWHDPGRLAGLG